MSDPQVINTLRAKAENLQGYIAKLEADLEQARADLSHVVATLRLFEAPGAGDPFPMHYNLDRLFRRREIGELCHKALASGPLSTRELADYIIREKGFPAPDRHLRTSVAYRVVQALRMQEKRGRNVMRIGKERQCHNMGAFQVLHSTATRNQQANLWFIALINLSDTLAGAVQSMELRNTSHTNRLWIVNEA